MFLRALDFCTRLAADEVTRLCAWVGDRAKSTVSTHSVRQVRESDGTIENEDPNRGSTFTAFRLIAIIIITIVPHLRTEVQFLVTGPRSPGPAPSSQGRTNFSHLAFGLSGVEWMQICSHLMHHCCKTRKSQAGLFQVSEPTQGAPSVYPVVLLCAHNQSSGESLLCPQHTHTHTHSHKHTHTHLPLKLQAILSQITSTRCIFPIPSTTHTQSRISIALLRTGCSPSQQVQAWAQALHMDGTAAPCSSPVIGRAVLEASADGAWITHIDMQSPEADPGEE